MSRLPIEVSLAEAFQQSMHLSESRLESSSAQVDK